MTTEFKIPSSFENLIIHNEIETTVGAISVCSAHAEALDVCMCVAVSNVTLSDGRVLPRSIIFDQTFRDAAVSGDQEKLDLSQFIIQHEVGHFVNKHSRWPWTTPKRLLEMEAEADAYAFGVLGTTRKQSAMLIERVYKLSNKGKLNVGQRIALKFEMFYRIGKAIFR